jgi:hypothetical protein
MVGKSEAVPQVVRGDLNCLLADRMGDLSHWVRSRLDDQNPGLWAFAANLQSECEGGHTAANDRDIVIRGRGAVIRQAPLYLVRQDLPGLRAQLRKLRSHVHTSPARKSVASPA